MNRNAVCGCMAVSRIVKDETELVPAGGVCRSDLCGDVMSDGQSLARLTMEDQEYMEGFCPQDALARGTMFPDLVM